MLHSFWRLVARTLRPEKSASLTASHRHVHPALEALEDRWMPNATTIAGFVYDDANNSGIMDGNETGLAGVGVALLRSDGTQVATTTTDANGHYLFDSDPTINVTPQTKEVDATFPSLATNWTGTQNVAQFDPSLGTLTSVEIVTQGNLTSDTKVENEEPNQINVGVEVDGQFTVTGAGIGTLTSATATINNQGQLGASTGDTTFTGPSTTDFGPKSATANASTTLDASTQDLSAFIGTGTLSLTEAAQVSSTDTGTGNFDQNIRSQAGGTVQIIYTYIPSTGLKPGDYVVERTTEVPGFMDGQTTNDNVTPIPNSVGANTIDVHLTATSSSLQNNFAEVPPAALSGYVYHDLNANAQKDAGEPGLSGVSVTLTGTNSNGKAVNLSQQTGADGSYSFANLWAGSDYTITETTLPTGGFLSPNVQVGSQGGVAGNADIEQVNLGTGVIGVNNNFGHVLPSSLAGFVYVDANDNGVKDSGDAGIGNVAITLSGTNDQGAHVTQTTTTDSTGAYSFGTLRPGSYTISEAPPPGFIDGIDTPGNLGGTAGTDQLFVQLGENKNGINYNFGELTTPIPPPPPPVVPPVTPQGPPIPIPPPNTPPISKDLFLGNDWLTWVAM